MKTTFINTKNSRTNESNKFRYYFTGVVENRVM